MLTAIVSRGACSVVTHVLLLEQCENISASPLMCTLVQTMAEREAWRLAKEHGLDLVAILPNFVLGPTLSSRIDGLSMGFLKACR